MTALGADDLGSGSKGRKGGGRRKERVMPSRSHRPNAPPEPPITREQAAIASKVLHKAWDCGHALGASQLTQAEKDCIVAEINA